jgi:hypothetical protein
MGDAWKGLGLAGTVLSAAEGRHWEPFSEARDREAFFRVRELRRTAGTLRLMTRFPSEFGRGEISAGAASWEWKAQFLRRSDVEFAAIAEQKFAVSMGGNLEGERWLWW